MPPAPPRSARPGPGDLRDAALLLGIATSLGLGSLAVRENVPWIAAEPEPAAASCMIEGELDAWDPPSMPRIGPAEVARHLDEGQITVVDARAPHDYARAHIPGAISLPWDEAEAVLAVQTLPIPPGDLVVTYCDGDGAAEAVGRLLGASAGCSQVHVLEGGWSAWVASGGPVDEVDHDG